MSVLPLPRRIISIDTIFYQLIQYSRLIMFSSGTFKITFIGFWLILIRMQSQWLLLPWSPCRWYALFTFSLLLTFLSFGFQQTDNKSSVDFVCVNLPWDWWTSWYISLYFQNFGHYFFWQLYALIFSLYHCNHIIVRWKEVYQEN